MVRGSAVPSSIVMLSIRSALPGDVRPGAVTHAAKIFARSIRAQHGSSTPTVVSRGHIVI